MQRLVGSLQKNSVNIRAYEERRDLFYSSLTAFGYHVVKPQGAFYLFPKAPIEDEVAFTKELQERRILVVPGRGFGNRAISGSPTVLTRRRSKRPSRGSKRLPRKLPHEA